MSSRCVRSKHSGDEANVRREAPAPTSGVTLAGFHHITMNLRPCSIQPSLKLHVVTPVERSSSRASLPKRAAAIVTHRRLPMWTAAP